MLALVLGACRLDVDVAVTMAGDGSGSVRVTATADRELLARYPSLPADLRLDDARAAGWTVDGPSPTGDGGTRVVVSKAFRTPEEAEALLDEVGGAWGPLQEVRIALEREFATVRSEFGASFALDGDVAAFADAALTRELGRVPLAAELDAAAVSLDQALRLTVTVDLPGEARDANGTVSPDGGSVTWEPSLRGDRALLAAEFVERDEGALSARRTERWARGALVVYVLALAAVAGGLGVRFVLGRR